MSERKFNRLWERYDEADWGNADQMREILETTLNALEGAESSLALVENALRKKVPDEIDGSKLAHVYLDATTIDKVDAYVKGFNACRAKMLR